VEAFVSGRHLELLSPVGFLSPAELSNAELPAGGVVDQALPEALAAANLHWGHSAAARMAAKLSDPVTRVVMTGQQPGLFGGPLYTLSKAVAATLWAKRLERQGVAAVALFWIASEDHDFKEISQAVFLAPQGPFAVSLGPDGHPLAPVGPRQLGAGVIEPLAELRDKMPGDLFGAWLDQLAAWYRPDATFSEAFARLMVHLLGDRCPLLVDATMPALKAAQRPWLSRVVERRHAISDAFSRRDQQIGELGYDLQVKPQPRTSPLFLLHEGERRRVEWEGEDHLRLRGREEFEERVDWLLEVIADQPERVSPGVRARSAIQDAVFGTSLQILGPGELSYLPQVAPLFSLLGIAAPGVTLRPQTLVVEEHQMDKLAATGLALRELLDPGLDLDARLADPQTTHFVEQAEQGLTRLLEELKSPAIGLDPDLERPWLKTRDQMARALQSFGSRVNAAAARRDETTRRRVEALRSACLPMGIPQERLVASAHFPGKYGDRFIAALFEQMSVDAGRLQIISP
jgi:bacillithiol biosynthesis cysteine-adding enzyme BshC